jgi:hypothetical protein
MKLFGVLLITLGLAACANEVDFKVPDHIKTSGETTVNVVHQIAVSVELQNAFEDECSQELPDATEEQLASCRDAKIKKFIDQFLQLLNQTQQTEVPSANP